MDLGLFNVSDTYQYVLNQSGANAITLGNGTAVNWNAGGVVALTGNQSISGEKYFNNNIGIGTNTPLSTLDVRGSITNYVGTAGNQTILQNWGWGNAIPRWKPVIESNANFAFYGYDSAGNSPAARITISNSDGNVGIGRSPLTNKLEVEGTVASKTSGTTWATNSDKRIKKAINTITDALEKICKVRLVKFKYTDEYKKDHPSIEDIEYLNVIAQEFAEVFPNDVKESGEKMPDGSPILQVDIHPLTIYSAAAIQELKQIIDSQNLRISELESKLL